MKIFLDTTIQVERLLYLPARRAEISCCLAGQQGYCSSYVFMEFKRTVLQDFAFLRSLVASGPGGLDERISLGEMIVKAATWRRVFSTRVRQRGSLIFATVVDEFAGRLPTKRQVLDYLEMQGVLYEQEYFFRQIDVPCGYLNATHCDLAKEEVRPGDLVTGRISCNGRRARCALVEFLDRYREELKEIEKALTAAPPAQIDARTLQSLRKVIADVRGARGERICWPLADVIVVLEAPADALIYTTDHHFKVLCTAIGKRLFQEPSGMVKKA